MDREIRTKSLSELLDKTMLDDSFVLGYYGGGNYGDELLFEVLQHLFKRYGYRTISFLYQSPSDYQTYHDDLGYQAVDAANKSGILRALHQRKNIIVGGGGLWGLDVNLNIVLMSLMMFMARWILGKNVYLVGVGYYGSTNRTGHFAAWLAGKSATQILARDQESYRNFSRLNRKTYLTHDIAFMLPDVIDETNVNHTVLETTLESLKGNVTMLSLRRFKPGQENPYADAVRTWLMRHPERPVILALMEPREIDPDGYEQAMEWRKERGNMEVIDFRYNPLELYRFFECHYDRLAFVGPQFHVQLVAHLAGVRLLPLVYDNKVAELLRKLDYPAPIAIANITPNDIETFAAAQETA